MFREEMSTFEMNAPTWQAPSIDITPEDLITETLAILKCSNKTRDQIVLSVTPSTVTFETVILPLAEDDNVRANRLKIFALLGSATRTFEKHPGKPKS